MPIEVGAEPRVVSEEEFKSIAYAVTGAAFDLHKEYGSLFAEIFLPIIFLPNSFSWQEYGWQEYWGLQCWMSRWACAMRVGNGGCEEK